MLTLEQELKGLESIMSEGDFYDREDVDVHTNRYNLLKKSLKEAEEEWELLVENMETSL